MQEKKRSKIIYWSFIRHICYFIFEKEMCKSFVFFFLVYFSNLSLFIFFPVFQFVFPSVVSMTFALLCLGVFFFFFCFAEKGILTKSSNGTVWGHYLLLLWWQWVQMRIEIMTAVCSFSFCHSLVFFFYPSVV